MILKCFFICVIMLIGVIVYLKLFSFVILLKLFIVLLNDYLSVNFFICFFMVLMIFNLFDICIFIFFNVINICFLFLYCIMVDVVFLFFMRIVLKLFRVVSIDVNLDI